MAHHVDYYRTIAKPNLPSTHYYFPNQSSLSAGQAVGHTGGGGGGDGGGGDSINRQVSSTGEDCLVRGVTIIISLHAPVLFRIIRRIIVGNTIMAE